MIRFQVNPNFTGLYNQSFIQNVAESALAVSGLAKDGCLTTVIDDSDFIHELNLRYRDTDSSTDVLSFPAGDLDPETGKLYHGDIIISFPEALQQAQAAGHSIDAELALLVVHGILHLAGYDHSTAEEKAEMWQVQNQILFMHGIDLGIS